MWGNQHYFKGMHRSFPAANVARTVPAITAACMMIDRDLYEQAGGLSHGYVQGGYEDSDLCLRLIELGRQNWYMPGAELYHLEAQSYPSDFRKMATRYNMWLHTNTWNDRIEEVSQELGLQPRASKDSALAEPCAMTAAARPRDRSQSLRRSTTCCSPRRQRGRRVGASSRRPVTGTSARRGRCR